MKTHRFVYLALIVALLLPSVAQAQTPAAAPLPGLTYDQAKLRLDQVMQGVGQLDGQLDRTQFDLDALAANIGFDAKDAVAFVHDQIAFEQYPGMLRGAQGTLLSRAGNALDQAVLLATLLDKQGCQTRIDRATLSPEQAQTLIHQMAAPRPAVPPIGNPDQIKATLTQIGQAAGKGDQEIAQLVDQALNPPALTATAPYQDAQRDTDTLLKTLQGAGVQLGDPNAMAGLVQEARDYYWVDYREDASSPWIAAHPAFKDAAAVPKGVQPAATFKDVPSLPPDVQYRFRFDVTVEQALHGKLATAAVLSVPDQPVADLVGTPFTFTNYSNGLAKAGSPVDIGKVLAQSTLFVPFVNGALEPNAHAFDLNGTTYQLSQVKPGEFTASPLPGAEVGNAASGALGAFGATATAAPTAAGHLTAEWIDYTITAPGGKTTTYRRAILDRLGPANRAAGKVEPAGPPDDAAKLALQQRKTFMLAPGAYPPSYVLHQALTRTLASRPLLDAALKRRYQPNAPVSVPDDVFAKVGSAWPGLPPLYLAFDAGAATTPDVVSYRPSPSLAVYREVVSPAAASGSTWTVTNAVDIVSNARRTLSVAGGHAALAPVAAVGTGVWETHEEGAIPTPPGATSFNTMAAFTQAAKAGVPIAVVKSESDLAASGLSLPADALAHLRADLAAGYVVVVPKAMPAGNVMIGWWRVDPSTGETLGMTSDGRGQTTAEYTMLIIGVACAGYAGFRGWSAGATLGNCGGIVVGYAAAAFFAASALTGLIIAVVFVLLGDWLG